MASGSDGSGKKKNIAEYYANKTAAAERQPKRSK